MIKVGILGCGSITIWRHAPEFFNNKNTKIVAFYDPVYERAQALVDQYGGTAYTDYKDIINNSEIDAVSICSPNETHAQFTIEALNAGKHVLCEKPMATSLEDSVSMQLAAIANNRFLMIGYSQRYFTTHIDAKKIIEQNQFGRVISFRGAFKNHGPDYWSIDNNKSTWFFDKKKSFFGPIGDLGVHKIDVLSWLLGEDFVEVSSNNFTLDKTDMNNKLIEIPDNSFSTLITKSGIVGTIESSWTSYGNCENSIILYCKDAIMYLNYEEEYDIVIITGDEKTIKINTKSGKTSEQLLNSGIIDEFVAAILENRQPYICGYDGIKSIATIDACFKSSDLDGKRTKVRSIDTLL